MLSLDTYYSSSQFKGTSGTNIGREGYVPQALQGQSGYFLRGDGQWIDVTTRYDSAYTTVQNNSGGWESVESTVLANSGNWSSVYTSFNSNSGKYDSDWTTTNNNSGRWESNWTSTNSNSSNWDASYSIVSTTSSTNTRGIDWLTSSISPSYAWTGVAYGNGLFVAVASDYGIAYSRDGINWVLNASLFTTNWTSITFGRGLFVAVANNGARRVMTSPDGINWTERSSESSSWTSVTYGNGLFVTVADSGTNRVMTSPDGVTWTPRTVTNYTWKSVAYGNGVYVAVSNSAGTPSINRVMTSTDGITWVQRAAASSDQWTSITYGNGLFVAGAGSGTARIMTSPDGISWTSRSVTGGNYSSIAYSSGIFIAVSTSLGTKLITSYDAINWTSRTVPDVSALFTSITYGNGMFVAVANSGTTRGIYSGRQILNDTLDNIRLGGYTATGLLSTTGIVYASGGNSDLWNSNWTTTNANSANWSSVYSSYNSISGRYTTLDYLSTNNVLLSSASIVDNLTVGLVAVSSTAPGAEGLTGLYRMTSEIFNGYPVFRNIYNNSFIARGFGPDAWYLYISTGTPTPVYYNTTTSGPWVGSWLIIPGRPSPVATVSIYNPYLNSLGTITVFNQGNSNQWNSNWTTTNANSANWSSVYSSYNSISGRYTTLDYLSTNNVLLSSATITNYLSTNTIYSSGTTGIISDSNIETGYGDFTLTLKFTNGVYVKNNLNALSNLSAGNVVYSKNGNSDLWNSNWTTTNTNSATWSSAYTLFSSNSGKYDSNWTTTNTNSATWSSAYTSFNSNSGKYDSNWTTTNTNSATWYSYTQNFNTFNTALATIDPSVLWVSTLSGILPAAEISSRLSASRGKIKGKIFFNMLNTIVNKTLYLRFSDNISFTGATNIINAGNANTQTLTRTFEGILLPGNQIIFSPSQGNVEDGTRNNPYTTYNYTPGASIYYQIGLSIGSGSEFAAISGGYISISPD